MARRTGARATWPGSRSSAWSPAPTARDSRRPGRPRPPGGAWPSPWASSRPAVLAAALQVWAKRIWLVSCMDEARSVQELGGVGHLPALHLVVDEGRAPGGGVLQHNRATDRGRPRPGLQGPPSWRPPCVFGPRGSLVSCMYRGGRGGQGVTRRGGGKGPFPEAPPAAPAGTTTTTSSSSNRSTPPAPCCRRPLQSRPPCVWAKRLSGELYAKLGLCKNLAGPPPRGGDRKGGLVLSASAWASSLHPLPHILLPWASGPAVLAAALRLGHEALVSCTRS